MPISDLAVFHCPGRVAAGPGSKPVCGAPDWNHDGHDYPVPPRSGLKPTHGDPHDAESLDGCESIGWDLSWGFRLNVGHDTAEDPTSSLTIGANFSDTDQARGIVVRETTPEQLEEFARLLLDIAAKHRRRMADDVQPAVVGPIVLERVRTDDHAYRVFEPHGVGTGFLTYDPDLGDVGTVTFDRVNRPAFDTEREARICWDLMQRGRTEAEREQAVFERLEYLYWRLAQQQATTDTRPKPPVVGS